MIRHSTCYWFVVVLLLPIIAKSQEYRDVFELISSQNLMSKCSIEFPNDLAKKYNMYCLKGSNLKSLSIRFPYTIKDTMQYYCSIKINIYENSNKAQINLKNFLCELNAPIPQITNSNFAIGDIAFGKEIDGIFLLAFCRNNVFSWIQAPSQLVEEIAKRIIENIETAPEWHYEKDLPHLLPW